MKFAHLIRLRVYAKEEDNEENVYNSFLSFLPFEIEKEKLIIKKTTAESFEHRKIKIFELTLTKTKHTNQFLQSLVNRLNDEQKELILKQAESRLDRELNFFLRFDKNKLINESVLWLTDSGDCFHIKISIAAFPANRKKAIEVIERLFTK